MKCAAAKASGLFVLAEAVAVQRARSLPIVLPPSLSGLVIAIWSPILM